MSRSQQSIRQYVMTASKVFQSIGDLDILFDVDLNLRKDEIVGLIGPSGGGKSVLLKTLAGVMPPAEGEIKMHLALDEEISLMFQEGALFDSVSVLDNVAFPLVHGRIPIANLPRQLKLSVCDKVGEILDKVGLAAHSHKIPGQLSGGMRRRCSLARALVNKPEIALLDDPTSGLDPVASSVIMKLIQELHKSIDTSMVIVSHDLRRLFPICSRIIALFDGRIVFNGTVDELRNSDLPEVKNFVRCRYDLQEAA